MSRSAVTVRPILAEDVSDAAAFLHHHLNSRVPEKAWHGLLRPPWGDWGPNHGFHLRDAEGSVVGVYAAVYARREEHLFCNLAAFCVLEHYRAQGLLLIRALLSQKDVVFTDFSPSGNVVAMNERLGFRRLDTGTRLVLNLPGRAGKGTRVTSEPELLEKMLSGPDAIVYRDHKTAAAAEHVLVTRDDRVGYLVYRRDRRKRLPLFASPLYAGGDRNLLAEAWNGVRGHLLRRGIPFTLAERRILGFARGAGLEVASPRPKMYRSREVDPATLDYLYSELALVRW
jgi:hypothetical protein